MHAPPPLFAFQETVVSRVLARHRHTYIGLEQGLGKSRIALTVASRMAQRARARRMLVIGPALGRVVWPDEAIKWLPPGRHMTILAHAPQDLRVSPAHDLTLVFASYDDLSRSPHAWLPALREFQPDLLVLDEAHRLGRLDSHRTGLVYGPKGDGVGGLVECCDLVLPMSGTPARNHVGELWPVLRALAPETIRHPTARRPLGQSEFIERYCTTRPTEWGMQVTGSKHVPALRQAVREFVIRMRVDDVMRDLPPIRFVTTPLPLSPAAGSDLDLPIDLARANHLDDDELLEWLQMQPLATARRAIGLRKVSAIIEWILDWLTTATDADKLLVFGKHPLVLHQVQAALGTAECDTVLIDGSTPTPARTIAVHRFQHDPRVRVFLGQIDAASEMVTLTAANTVAIAETEFVPTVVSQAAKRAHRIGQKRPVLVHLLVSPGTLDPRIARICARKASELAQMFDTPSQQELQGA